MASHRSTIIIFGLYSLAWTYLVSGKAIEGGSVGAAVATDGSGNLPPLIFPTDKQRYNIGPINKTAIKILLHEDDQAGRNDSMTKEKTIHKETGLLASGEADDLRRTDQEIATSEEAHAEYAKLHPQETKDVPVAVPSDGKGTKDQVENIQDVKPYAGAELEELYNRPQQQNLLSVSIVNINTDSTVRHHLAWVSVAVVLLMGLTVYAVLLLYRHKMEQRYGNRHRLFTDEDTL